jgi:hypothetical protein
LDPKWDLITFDEFGVVVGIVYIKILKEKEENGPRRKISYKLFMFFSGS